MPRHGTPPSQRLGNLVQHAADLGCGHASERTAAAIVASYLLICNGECDSSPTGKHQLVAFIKEDLRRTARNLNGPWLKQLPKSPATLAAVCPRLYQAAFPPEGPSPQQLQFCVGDFRAMLRSIPMRLNKLAQVQWHGQASSAGAALQQRPQDVMNMWGKMAQFMMQMQPQQRLQKQQSREDLDVPGFQLLGESARHCVQDLARTTAVALQGASPPSDAEVASTPARVHAEGSDQGRQAAEVAAASGGDAAAEVFSLDGKKRKRSPEEAAELLLKGIDDRAAEQKAKQGTKAKGISKTAAPVKKAHATQRKPTPGHPVTYKGATIHRKNQLTWRIYMRLASGKVVDSDRKVLDDENASFLGALARIDELVKESSS